MSKFKVGDRVRVIPAKKSGNRYETLYHMDGVSGISCIITEEMEEFLGKVVTVDGNRAFRYTIKEDNGEYNWTDEMFVGLATEPREFIVIRRDGQRTIAELRHGREVVKSAEAKCLPTDTFDFFNEGAPRAFDRLMGREEPKEKMGDKWWRGENPLPQPAPSACKFGCLAFNGICTVGKGSFDYVPFPCIREKCKAHRDYKEPQPAPRLKVGDRVVHEKLGFGSVIHDDGEEYRPYLILFEKDISVNRAISTHGITEEKNCAWVDVRALSPAPEPKYYSGKVTCIEAKADRAVLNGKIISIENGNIVEQGYSLHYGERFKTFGDFAQRHFLTRWIEV